MSYGRSGVAEPGRTGRVSHIPATTGRGTVAHWEPANRALLQRQPVAHPKPPGRKPGQGLFLHRPAPLGQATETIVVSKPESGPHCGGELEEERVEDATTTDLPIPTPVITRYRVPVCRCRKCGKTVRGSAPGFAPNQFGATAHRVGAGVMAAAHMLHYAIGIPVRRVPAVLGELTGISLTRGAITQDALRRAEGPVGSAYQELRQEVPKAQVAFPLAVLAIVALLKIPLLSRNALEFLQRLLDRSLAFVHGVYRRHRLWYP